VLRDIKWIINRHPLGTYIKIKTRVEYQPSASKQGITASHALKLVFEGKLPDFVA